MRDSSSARVDDWWKGTGEGKFAGIEDFEFAADITFTSVGQPFLSYQAFSTTPEGSRPMHLESGVLRVSTGNQEETQCAFLISHNFGEAGEEVVSIFSSYEKM